MRNELHVNLHTLLENFDLDVVLYSCRRISLFLIGEKPRARIPSVWRKRLSVAAGNITCFLFLMKSQVTPPTSPSSSKGLEKVCETRISLGAFEKNELLGQIERGRKDSVEEYKDCIADLVDCSADDLVTRSKHIRVGGHERRWRRRRKDPV